MTRTQAALTLTVLYWAVAVIFALAYPHHSYDLFDVRWIGAIGFFAIPVTALLWLVTLIVELRIRSLPQRRFLVVGLLLPVVYVAALALVVVTGNWRQQQRSQRLTDQANAARLLSITDEPLIGPKGPLGIRIRMRVEYPLGLDQGDTLAAVANPRVTNWGAEKLLSGPGM